MLNDSIQSIESFFNSHPRDFWGEFFHLGSVKRHYRVESSVNFFYFGDDVLIVFFYCHEPNFVADAQTIEQRSWLSHKYHRHGGHVEAFDFTMSNGDLGIGTIQAAYLAICHFRLTQTWRAQDG